MGGVSKRQHFGFDNFGGGFFSECAGVVGGWNDRELFEYVPI